jgi:hypothetical protein
MDERLVDVLFGLFEERMAEMCSVVPSDNSKSIVSQEWFSYVDSLAPHVTPIRPTEYMRSRAIVPRKTGNIPVVEILAQKVNEGGFDMIIVEDPGISGDHVPTWGPNLLLVQREFAEKAVALGCLP